MTRIRIVIAMLAVLLTAAVKMPAMGEEKCTQPQDSVAAADTVAKDYQVLTGKIGPYAVKMYLCISGAENDDVVGYYFYTAHPENHYSLKMVSMVAVNAKGTMDLVLHEYTARGKHSGTFDGSYECRGDYYAGTFTNSKGKKFKFVLK